MAEIIKKELDLEDKLALPDLEGQIDQSCGGERPCPACEDGYLRYDHFLNLVCNNCGYVESHCFTC